MVDENDISRAKQLADELRLSWPEKAAEIDRAILDVQSGRRETLKLSVGVKFRLEKYQGEYKPGATPTEIIEGEG
jgi:hypothetical protein